MYLLLYTVSTKAKHFFTFRKYYFTYRKFMGSDPITKFLRCVLDEGRLAPTLALVLSYLRYVLAFAQLSISSKFLCTANCSTYI